MPVWLILLFLKFGVSSVPLLGSIIKYFFFSFLFVKKKKKDL